MKKAVITAALPLFVMAGLAAQQAPPTPSATVQPTTTLAGCLYREDQIPGRKPNVAERAGVLEDYILADASTSSSKPGATPGAAITTGNMYKVEGPRDDKLKSLVGKRVEVTGRIDPEGGPGARGTPRADRGLGPDGINLPEFEATSIRETSGTCPARPAPAK